MCIEVVTRYGLLFSRMRLSNSIMRLLWRIGLRLLLVVRRKSVSKKYVRKEGWMDIVDIMVGLWGICILWALVDIGLLKRYE